MTLDELNNECRQIQALIEKPPSRREADEMFSYLEQLDANISRAAELEAVALGMLMEAKGRCAKDMNVGKGGEFEYYGAKQVGDIINGLCSKYIEAHKRAERTNAAVTHTADNYRSIISALKDEWRAANTNYGVQKERTGIRTYREPTI